MRNTLKGDQGLMVGRTRAAAQRIVDLTSNPRPELVLWQEWLIEANQNLQQCFADMDSAEIKKKADLVMGTSKPLIRAYQSCRIASFVPSGGPGWKIEYYDLSGPAEKRSADVKFEDVEEFLKGI